uniref:uncharacterized protein LOC143308651 isoform X4 n=1 Tax=Arvicanthis niloticus TaxID=61156 RepID=UPI00402BD4E8
MMSVSLQLRDSGFKLDSSSAQDTTKASCGSWQIIQTWSAWENLPGLQTEKQHVTSAGWRYAKDGGYGSYTRGRIFSKKTTMDNSVEWAGNSPSASGKNDSPVMLEVLILMLASRLILLRPLMGH